MIELVAAGLILVLVAIVAAVAAFIWALVDMLEAKNEPEWKILWLLVIILLPFLGIILYLAVGRNQRIAGKKRA